ncbi:hypothetical protein [Jiangella gansuensis]|uniref:hypothetical protein n=1 Tax=Jiangella gansuensis TaxID=281473 RepID=UPI001B7FE6A1|nr:hypothetical protein [Jiangella gansuensis]
MAAWFGGTLANAIALNPAAGAAGDASSTGAVANIGWDRWTPVNAAAIGVHLVGSTGQLVGNMGRLRAQRGVATMAIAKTALTAAALAATSYSRAVGKKASDRTDVPASSGTDPDEATPPKTAAAQRQLSVLQWAVPALTGALIVVSSFAGEQERASQVHGGVLARIKS